MTNEPATNEPATNEPATNEPATGQSSANQPSAMRLTNEYATVSVELDHEAAGPRLRITDLASNVFVCLDPLELQSLAWTRHVDFTPIMDPAYREAILDAGSAEAVPSEHAASADDPRAPWHAEMGIGEDRRTFSWEADDGV
jgi:hypothetical protein